MGVNYHTQVRLTRLYFSGFFILLSENAFDKFRGVSGTLINLFNNETKQNYNSSTRISLDDAVTNWQKWREEFSYQFKLETNSSSENTIPKNTNHRMHLRDSLETCDCLYEFIHIFKHFS